MRANFSIILLLFTVGALFGQTSIGTVSFIIGESEYSAEGSSEWMRLKLSDNIRSNWIIQTGEDAELEITWDNGETTELGPGQKIKVLDLIKDLKVQTQWLDRVKNKLGVLLSQAENESIKGVAGVRRDETKVERKDTLYWSEVKEADFYEGYEAFRNNDFEKAVSLFEDVAAQSPLSKKGEYSRICLITIYSEIDKKEKAKDHLDSYLRDFPDSEMANIMKELYEQK
jgi:hypothetical protein